MTGPPMPVTDPGRPNLPPLHRILTPDEFHQAQQLTPDALSQSPFPLLPPAPKDVVRANDPNQGPDRSLNPQSATTFGAAAGNFVQGLLSHPISTAVTVPLSLEGGLLGKATRYGFGVIMGHDIASYVAQKAAEHTLAPDVKAMAEADPTRISGGQAGFEAALMTAVPLGARWLKAVKEGGAATPESNPAPDPGRLVDGVRQPPAEMTGQTGVPKNYVPPIVELKKAVEQHSRDVADAFNQIFDPASRSPEAGQAAGILRATTGHQAAAYEQAAFKLDEFRRAIDPLPAGDKYAFIDAIEGGKAQPNPEFQPAADAMRTILDNARSEVQNLGTGKLNQWIEDYFPHIWQDPEGAKAAFAGKDALESAKIMGGSKRPMAGSGSFLKERTIPTTADGLAMGLKPVSDNPVDLTLLKLREMQRYVMAHQSLGEMKDAGLVKYVGSGGEIPDGYARINDKVATVFGPRQGAVQLPDEANITPEQVTVPGRRIMGEYWAPEPVARVVNNYLSPGLRGNAIYDAYRGIGNTLNQAQLGFSAFHLGMTSLDATVSRSALGMEYLASGEIGKGLGEIASSPVAPVTNMMLGAKIRAAYLDPANASPEMQALANAVQEAGGRIKQDSFYKNSAAEKMITAWKEGSPVKAGAYAMPALFEKMAAPIMEHIVPMQKLGVFGDLAQKVLADLPDDATLAVRREALGKAWDSVDNRMGQLVYDNLFWNRTVKDLSMASVRSVGWNLGTIRELGGGIKDIPDLAHGELTHRTAYLAALPVIVGMYGAAYQMLRTGEAPAELKDYFHPKTGDQDADGNPERVNLPSYMKDIFAYAGDPWGTVKHKVSPMAAGAVEMLNNQDFYGDQIRNPNDPVVQQLQQEASYLAKEFVPLSLRNLGEQNARGDQSFATKAGNFIGITPAKRSDVRSDAQNLMASYLQTGPSNRTPEAVDLARTKASILNAMQTGDKDGQLTDAVAQAIAEHQLTPKDLASLLKRAGSTPAQAKFKMLTLPQALEVFNKSTDEEKAKFGGLLVKKIESAAKQNASSSGAP